MSCLLVIVVLFMALLSEILCMKLREEWPVGFPSGSVPGLVMLAPPNPFLAILASPDLVFHGHMTSRPTKDIPH